MRLLSIDPSSTACGYALLEAHNRLIEFGTVTPDEALENPMRIQGMATEVAEIVVDLRPDDILIELPAKQAPHGKHGAAGQATYGMGVGIVYCEVVHALKAAGLSPTWHYLRSDDWSRMVHRTKGSDAKAKARRAERCRKLRALFPSYDSRRDPGQDIADAIEMGAWFFGRQMKPGAVIAA